MFRKSKLTASNSQSKIFPRTVVVPKHRNLPRRWACGKWVEARWVDANKAFHNLNLRIIIRVKGFPNKE